MRRNEALESAVALIDGDRDVEYGHPVDSLTRIGRMWGAVLDLSDIPAPTVALMLAVMKASRLSHQVGHEDSWVDMAGYAALGCEVSSS